MSCSQNRVVVACMAPGRTDVADTAVTVIGVVPAHEAGRPGAGLIEVGKALDGELRPVLGGTKQRLGIGVVVTDARPGVRGFDAQPVEHRQYGGGLALSVEPLSPCSTGLRPSRQCPRPARYGALGARRDRHHGLPSPRSCGCTGRGSDTGRTIVPAPDLAGRSGHMRGGWTNGLGRLGPPAVGGLPMRPQHAAEGGFAGQIDALVGQHGPATSALRLLPGTFGYAERAQAPFLYKPSYRGTEGKTTKPCTCCLRTLLVAIGLPGYVAGIDADINWNTQLVNRRGR